MSLLDSLPPDQRAVLQLILGQGRTYADIAGMLKMEPDAVRSRAHAAAETLSAGAELRPPAAHREEIVDYLLGQQEDADATRAYLAGSASGRDFAWALVPELAPLAREGLPEIPGDDDEMELEMETEPAMPAVPPPVQVPEADSWAPSASASPSSRSRVPGPRRSSRLGGALLLAGVAIVAAVVLILLLTGGGDNKKKASATTQTSTQPVTTEAQINLRPAHSGSKALGVAQILRQNGVRAMAMVGQDLEPTSATKFYAVWLYNSPSDAVRLGFTPNVGADKKLQALLPKLPANASRFKELLLTRESTEDPKQPGFFVLRGALSLKGS